MESENNNLNLTSLRIKQMRLDNNWTQKDLAQKLGLKNDTAIANYEAGYSIPKDEIKLKMCELFNCSIDYLMGKSDFKSKLEFFNRYNNTLYRIDVSDAILRSIIKNASVNNKKIPYYKYVNDIHNFFKNSSLKDLSEDKIKNYVLQFPVEEQEDILSIMKSILDDITFAQSSRDHYSVYKNNLEKDYMQLTNVPVVGKISAGQPILAEQHIESYLPVDPNIYGLSTSDDLFYLLVSGDSMNQKVENGDYVLVHKQDYAEDGDIIVAIVNDDDEATLKRYKEINQQFIQLEPMSTNPIHQTRTIDLKNTYFKIIGKAIGKFGKF